MNTREIAPPDWKAFCESFSLKHHGWLVSIAVTDSSVADSGESPMQQKLIENQPLNDIREQHIDGYDEIMISVGEDQEEVSILVQDVSGLYEQTDENRDSGLRIDSARANSTIIQFRSAADPVQLDGIAESEI